MKQVIHVIFTVLHFFTGNDRYLAPSFLTFSTQQASMKLSWVFKNIPEVSWKGKNSNFLNPSSWLLGITSACLFCSFPQKKTKKKKPQKNPPHNSISLSIILLLVILLCLLVYFLWHIPSWHCHLPSLHSPSSYSYLCITMLNNQVLINCMFCCSSNWITCEISCAD